eukprot:GHVO01006138.1.p1 GENE.GHVO01006138.1~~GHVO01006138.1.p1  ORF type:complete len:300 (-),score=32.27 GHVO01006138.1:726-1625(-)
MDHVAELGKAVLKRDYLPQDETAAETPAPPTKVRRTSQADDNKELVLKLSRAQTFDEVMSLMSYAPGVPCPFVPDPPVLASAYQRMTQLVYESLKKKGRGKHAPTNITKFLDFIEERIRLQITDDPKKFTAHDLFALFVPLAHRTSKSGEESLLVKVQVEIVTHYGEFHVKQLAAMLTIFARLKQPAVPPKEYFRNDREIEKTFATKFFEFIAVELRQQPDEVRNLDHKTLVSIAKALAYIQFRDMQLARMLANCLMNSKTKLTDTEMAECTESLSKHGVTLEGKKLSEIRAAQRTSSA